MGVESETQPPRQSRVPTLLLVLVFLTFCAVAVIVAVLLATNDDDDGGANGTPTSEGAPDPAGLAAYIDRLEEVGTALDDRTAELQTQLNEDLAVTDSESARLELVKQNFIDTAAANEEFVAGLEDTSPPDALSQSHANMIEAGQAYVAAYQELADRLEGVTGFDEVEPIIRDPSFEEQRSAFLDTCGSLANAIQDLGESVAFFC
jgi:hypothetical protein